MDSYTEIYDIAERFFSWKRAQLITLLKDDLAAHFAERSGDRVKIVDFGSGDGRLICDIVSGLPDNMRHAIELTCVEPEDSNFAALTETFNGKAGWFADLNLTQDTMAGYLGKVSENFDACLITHTLYHMPVEDWPAEVSAALERLNRNGAAYITLVEEDTDAYNLAKTHGLVENDNNDAIGGDYVFAADLDTALTQTEYGDLQKLANQGYLNMAAIDVDFFVDTVRNNPEKLPENPFVRFLGFILRKDVTEIAANKDLLEGFITHFETKGMLNTTDTVYKLTPPRP